MVWLWMAVALSMLVNVILLAAVGLLLRSLRAQHDAAEDYRLEAQQLRSAPERARSAPAPAVQLDVAAG